MRISWKNADRRRVLPIYSAYVALFLLLMWPLQKTDHGWEPAAPFRWYWEVYLGDSDQIHKILILIMLFEFAFAIIVVCFVHLKPIQNREVEYDDYTYPCQANTTSLEDASEKKRKVISVSDRSFHDKIGVIVPCHKSEEVIQSTLKGLLHHFRPEHIIVMDNGKTEKPMDDTILCVRDVSDKIIYKWVPVGHKSMALLLGNRLLPDTVKYVLLLDDDVLIPKTMVFDDSYFKDDQVSCIAYSIAVHGHKGTVESMNLVQRLTDFEFKFADTFRAFMSSYSSVVFAHGAIGLWRRDRFSEIYENHPGLPIGEDGWAGRLNLKAGYTMKQDSGPLIRTESPPLLIPTQWWSWMLHKDQPSKRQHIAGFGSPDLFNQRARRWDMNAPRRIPLHIKLFFSYGWNQFKRTNPLRAIIFNLVIRFNLMRGFWTFFKTYFYMGYIIHTFMYGEAKWVLSWMVAAYILQVLKYLFINLWVWRKRRDLRVGPVTILLFPLYRSILALFRFYAYWRSLLKYIPIIKAPKSVLGQTEEVAKLHPFLLRQRDIDIWPTSEVHDKFEEFSLASQSSEDSLYLRFSC